MDMSNIIEIFQDRNIVIPLYLFKRIKEFKLKTDEFMFLMYLYNLGDKFVFDPNRFSNDLNISNNKVMKYIETLTEKHFIRVEVLKNDKGLMEEVVLLEDFYNKISLKTISNNIDKQDSNIFEIIEKEFGRTLSPMEYEIIKAWLDNNIKEELIKEAIKEATFNGVSNLRYIDKILYEWGKKGIKNSKDVENNRKKRNNKKEDNNDVDLDIVDWNWFDEE
ncbi:MAG: DnaD domain protein [Bacilli bacterium]|nr:DnaD domain protein [Bacilli bacterium]